MLRFEEDFCMATVSHPTPEEIVPLLSTDFART
jgi:hypothetical protein